MEELRKSPFKFLDAFEKEDKDLFFGREDEVKHLYDMTFETRLIVFFGASGTGKTSMIQCGLANKFSETRWQELYIRRENNINQAIVNQLKTIVNQYHKGQELSDPIEGLRLLHRYTSKPIFITFDQFEELFILQPNVEEQEEFFQFIQTLLHTPLACKVIIVMREEFIAHLWDYEYLVPSIFENRFRIKLLQAEKVEEIIKNTFAQLQEQRKITVEEPDKISITILEKLASGKTGFALTYLQVFLDRLYRLSIQETETPPVLKMSTLERMGTMEDVIDDFLDEQLNILEKKLNLSRKGIPLRILGAMVSDERTKKVLEIEDIDSLRRHYGLTEEEMNICLQAFESMRILNRYES